MEVEDMGEAGSRGNSFQRKKPPWLKLDIPTIQLTPDDTPQIAQVRHKKGSSNVFSGDSGDNCFHPLWVFCSLWSESAVWACQEKIHTHISLPWKLPTTTSNPLWRGRPSCSPSRGSTQTNWHISMKGYQLYPPSVIFSPLLHVLIYLSCLCKKNSSILFLYFWI